MDTNALAELLFSHITRVPADYEALYPPRDLPEGARVTRALVADGVRIGRNTAVTGVTVPEDYPDGALASGEILDKAGVVS